MQFPFSGYGAAPVPRPPLAHQHPEAMKARTKPLPSGLFAAIFFTLLFIFAVTASRAQGRSTVTGRVQSTEVSGEAQRLSTPLGINGF